MRDRMAALGSLAVHLGPWSGLVSPAGYRTETRAIRTARGPMKARWYVPQAARPRGAYLIAPGLHPDGPSDPRFDRFCASLAAAGFAVLAPFLPDSQALLVAPTAAADLDAAMGYLLGETGALGLPRPAIFSISFGSLPAAEVAAARGEQAGALVLFGGYADFGAAVRFATSGEVPGRSGGAFVPSDPLNRPAVFLNILPFLQTQHRDELAAAWRRVVRRTWGRMELKRPGSRWGIAEEEGASLPGAVKELFYIGCGLLPGGVRLVEEGLRRAGSHFAFADPRPALGRVRAPVVIAHGRGDDVIPYTEAEALAAALPEGHPKKVYLTGFYDHTGSALPRPAELLREATQLGGILRALAAAPLGVL